MSTGTRNAKLPANWRDTAEARCREKGARLTPARLEAYGELLGSDRPLTAYELIARLETRQERKLHR